MKRQPFSLKLFVAVIFLVLSLVMIVGYSFLSFYFFRKGVDSNTAVNMEEAAVSYLKAVPLDQRTFPTQFYGYHLSDTWKSLPVELQLAFDSPPSERQRFKIARESSDPNKRPDLLSFIFRYEKDGEVLFVGRRMYRAPKVPTLLGESSQESRRTIIFISVFIVAILAISIYLLFKKISKPVAALEKWTSSLGPENLEQPPPDFSYPELNNMAELVRSSLSSVQESLDREHRFLRYASHELRTPIAIIRNNIELVSKIATLPEPRRSEEYAQLLARIDRASLNMEHLTEILLWLHRDDVDNLPPKSVRFDEMVQQTVDEMRYLLDRKEIRLQVKTTPSTIVCPEIPIQIVVRNLIRNAFQHTSDGVVSIDQQETALIVTNSKPAEEGQAGPGFGFGLQLLQQMTEKIGWIYCVDSDKTRYKASVSF